MKKAAAIDIGTNSARLLLCEISENKIVSKSKELATIRLGEDMTRTSAISPKAAKRGVDALNIFKDKAQRFGAQEIVAIGTSAVRDAKNRKDFTDLIKEETGIEIKVIDGEEEAMLAIAGVTSEDTFSDQKILIVDIGGGSTELIYGTKTNIEYVQSINAGAVRMTEGFISGNPIKDEDIDKLKLELKQLFKKPIEELLCKKPDRIIAVGGVATTAAAMFHKLFVYNTDIVHNTVLSKEYVENTANLLKGMSIAQRYTLAGLQKERADIIPAGMYILLHLIEELQTYNITISENDNLEGMIIRHIIDGNN